MPPADDSALHFLGNSSLVWAAQAVRAGPEQKVGLFVARGTEQLENVALSITDGNTPLGDCQLSNGQAKGFDPTDTLFLLNRDSGWVHASFERVGALEGCSCPELGRAKPKRSYFYCYSQTGMNQDSAGGIVSWLKRGSSRHTALLQDTNPRRVVPLINTLSCIMLD